MPNRTTHRLKLALATVALCGPAPLASAAEQQPRARVPETPSGRAPAESKQPVRPQANPTVNDASVVVQRTGGSLLKAQLSSMPPAAPDAKRPRDVSFFAIPEPEPRTIRKHDLVTIIVREESEYSAQGTTDTTRESDIDVRLEEFIKLRMRNWEVEGAGIGPTPPSIKASAKRNFKGEGTVDRTDSLTARVTGEVVDVKPNGTLVVQARKTIKTDDEEQQFVLTGSCRVEDIVADNTILSTQLYDLRVEKNHKGAVRSATRRGWLTNIVDAISPF